MSQVQEFLESFDRLSTDDQREVLDELLKRSLRIDYPPLDEETINRIADESCLAYDDHEAAYVEG